MPCFQFGGEIEARGPHLVPVAGFLLAVFPDRGVQATGDAAAHQRMVGGMELDHVEPPALPVMGFQPRRLVVGEPRQFLGLVAHHETALRVEFLAHGFGKFLRQSAPAADRPAMHSCPSAAAAGW